MGKIEQCTVTTVHTDAAEPYYTVTLSNGSTRTTEAAHVLVPASPPPASAPVASADPFAELTGGGVSANSNGKTAPFQPNDRVLYKPPKGSTLPPEKATVFKVHWDAGDPPLLFYSARLDRCGKTDGRTTAWRSSFPTTTRAPRRRRRRWIGPKCNSRPWVLVHGLPAGLCPAAAGLPAAAVSAAGLCSAAAGLSAQQGYPQQPQFGGGAPAFGGQPGFPPQQQPGFPPQQPGFPQQQPGFPQQQPGFQQQQQGFPAAPQMNMQQQPQGGFPGGFPGQGGF